MAEVRELGLELDLSRGTFYRTEYRDGALQLAQVGVSDAGHEIYYESGYWESEDSFLKDRVAAFSKVSESSVVIKNGTFKVMTASSPDRVTWTEWQEAAADTGEIQSPVNTYAKVRIELRSAKTVESFTVDDFKDAAKYSNPYLDYSNGSLNSKRDYPSTMNVDSSWTGSGKVYSGSVDRVNLSRVDRLAVDTDGMRHFIKVDGQYISYKDGVKQMVASPSQADYVNMGMDDLSVLDRKRTVMEFAMSSDGSVGNGRVFRRTVDLKRLVQIKGMEILGGGA